MADHMDEPPQKLAKTTTDTEQHSTSSTNSISRGDFFSTENNGDLISHLNGVISSNEQNLNFSCKNKDQLEQLKTLRFPKVKTLAFNLFDTPLKYNDDCTLQLFDMFPNVVTLTLDFPLRGTNLWKFATVKNLHIKIGDHLCASSCDRIFETLKLQRLSVLKGIGLNKPKTLDIFKNIRHCKTLRELEITDNYLLHFVKYSKELPQLHKLVVHIYECATDEIIKGVLAHDIGTGIREIICNEPRPSTRVEFAECLNEIPKLETLIINDYSLNSKDIRQLANNLKNLCEFRLLASVFTQKTKRGTYDKSVLKIVENCPDMQVLNLSNTNIGANFLKQLQSLVKQQTERTVPLELHCFNTAVKIDTQNASAINTAKLRVILEEHIECRIPEAQIAFVLVSKQQERFLEERSESITHHQHKIQINCRDFSKSEMNNLIDYLKSIGSHIQDFNITCENNFEMLKALRFPKVKTLSVHLWKTSWKYWYDDCTRQLCDMFPNVIDLTLDYALFGLHLWQFTTVENVHITNGSSLELKHCDRMFESLRLKRLSILNVQPKPDSTHIFENIAQCATIEELETNDRGIRDTVKYITALPKLCRLTVHSGYVFDDNFIVSIMRDIGDAFGPNIRKIIYNEQIESLNREPLTCILQTADLESLTMNDYLLDPQNIGRSIQNFRKLREFRLLLSSTNSKRGTYDKTILKIVRNCIDLQILDLTHIKIGEEFLKRLNSVVEHQTERKVPLQFYCFNTVVTNDMEKNSKTSGKVKVIFDNQAYDWLKHYYFDIFWKPIK